MSTLWTPKLSNLINGFQCIVEDHSSSKGLRCYWREVMDYKYIYLES